MAKRKRKYKAAKRYYAQHLTAEQDPFGPNWFVFDRNFIDEQGEVACIACCLTRSTAFQVRDALNLADNVAGEL